MNRMADVAALFGKKLGEEFVVKSDSVFGEVRNEVVFLDGGFYYKGENYSKVDKVKWFPSKEILYDLIVGNAVIIDE